jgi:hypothetical protein
MISRVTTSSSTVININGSSFTISKTHPFYVEILEELALKSAPDETYLLSLLNVKEKIKAQVFGRVKIVDQAVFYDDKPVGNALTKRIIDMLSQGYDIAPWGLFMDNVMLNPVVTAREELYRFLESASMPITPDGHFLAFKKVKEDLTSFYDANTQHILGKEMFIPMNEVDTDYRNQCSSGLHFCSESYLSIYHGGQGVTIVVKINPKDVVAIPDDYSNAKGRAWCYTPIAVIGAETEAKNEIFSKPVVGQVKGIDTFNDVRLKETRKDKASKVKFNGLGPKKFMKAVTREGGARPYARVNDLPKSTVQDWVKKAKEIIGGYND